MAQKVYVTRVIPQPGIDLLREQVDVEVNETDEPLTQSELEARAAGSDALVTLLTDKIDRKILEAGKGKLKICANVAVGFDNVDITSATEFGIMVSNTPGVLTETTADFAWTLLMATARRVCEADRFFRAGKYHGWGIMMMLGGDIHGKTLGLVGFGRIGQAMAKRAAGFDMNVLYHDPQVRQEDVPTNLRATSVDLETLLRQSDFVSLHTLLTDDTRHLISGPQLDSMKPTAYLINSARGPIVDEAALVEALRSNKIAGAGLDVFENEPEAARGLIELENVIVSPHIASASVETRTRMATMAAENVLAALREERPPTLVNAEVLS